VSIRQQLIQRLTQQFRAEQAQELALTPEQLWAQDKWQGRLTTGSKWKQMLPTGYRDGETRISIQAAKRSEKATGKWMSEQKLQTVINFWQENKHSVKLARGLCVEIGLGTWRGYGHIKWAIRSGLTPIFYDWAEQALINARRGLGRSLGLHPTSPIIHRMVKLGEAKQICQALDPDKVRIFIASTLLEHLGYGLKDEGERMRLIITVIQDIGRLLTNPSNQVLIINTPPHGGARLGSIALPNPFILEHLEIGAKRKLWVPYQEDHKSATSILSSMLVRADVR